MNKKERERFDQAVINILNDITLVLSDVAEKEHQKELMYRAMGKVMQLQGLMEK